MSSDDSTDEEHLQMLRDAANCEFMSDSLFTRTSQKEGLPSTKQTNLKSLRPLQEDESDQFNLLNVTPEFQQYVAKCLNAILEKQLRTATVENLIKCGHKVKKVKSRVKLFSDSKHYIQSIDEPAEEITTKKPKIRKRKLSDDNSSGNEKSKMKSVAVSPEHVLSKIDTKCWSDRSKAEVFRYRQCSSGKLVKIETM